MAQQLSFDLPVTVSLGEADFFVAPPNATAYAMVTHAGGWPDGKLALAGPTGSGKSHLTRIWQSHNDGLILNAKALTGAEDLPPPGARVAVEDMDRLQQQAEEYMFHLHNHLRNTGGQLLLTGATAPSRWDIALPDLASRMQAATVVTIDNPDDDLLRVLLLKHFADRQLDPAPEVISYLARRIERSFQAASDIVATLDTTALNRKSPITRALARDVLDS